MELVGSPLEVERTNHEKWLTIVDKLSLIHSFGILHENQQKSDFAKEMKQLKALLELLPNASKTIGNIKSYHKEQPHSNLYQKQIAKGSRKQKLGSRESSLS
ncbi:10432_t:CDS:2 [Paraglomus brasilianum]|uniref:10432_t:CDS:1 n=1 Tax=Paraglomus brasilianum TaxID=144538 RepID=A0A9N9DBL5_9GLOM|nr:10432_t:CDS:2 [Paraglomus brasilianum]